MKNILIEVDDLPLILQKNIKNKQLIEFSKIYKSLKNTIKTESSKVLKIVNQIPIISHALKFEKGFLAVIPEKFREGLKNGTYKIMKGKDGSLISTIVDAKTGDTVHQIRLTEFTKMVNPAELSQAMNQICMQMQLEEINKELVEFRIETNLKLNEILQNQHYDRMIPEESVELNFKRYQNGQIDNKDMFLEIDKAQANLQTDIQVQIKSIKDKVGSSVNKEQSEEIQVKICNIIEAINRMQRLYLIESYIYRKNEIKCREISNAYIKSLLNILNEDNIKLLDGFSDFEYLGLTKNIWEENLMPMYKKFCIQNSDMEKFKLEDASNEVL